MTSLGKCRPEKMLTAPASCHARHPAPKFATAPKKGDDDDEEAEE
jgi:hypothetical protein